MAENVKYALGFLLGNGGGSAPAHYRAVPFPAPLLASPDMKLGRAASERGAIVVIGEAIDPDSPELDHDGVARLLVDHFDDRQAHIDRLVGRFAVIVAVADGAVGIQTDAIGLRSVYFSREGGTVLAGSHAKMVSEAASPERAVPVARPYKYGQPGMDTPYAGVYRLPANLELSLSSGALRRFFPVEAIPPATIEDMWSLAFDRARQAIGGLMRRAPVIVSLSAGLDTRTTLAAARDAWDRLSFFTYLRSPYRHRADVLVSEDIARTLGLRHQTLNVLEYRADRAQLQQVGQNSIIRHGLQLACMYRERFGVQQFVHIRSNLLELGRSNLYAKARDTGTHPSGPSSPQTMAAYYNTSAGKPLEWSDHVLAAFERQARETAFEEALAIASPWDLYFVEHRMGSWQGGVVTESDIAFDTIIAFNSRQIVRRIMGVPQEVRSTSGHLLERLLQMMPEIAHIPINPESYGPDATRGQEALQQPEARRQRNMPAPARSGSAAAQDNAAQGSPGRHTPG